MPCGSIKKDKAMAKNRTSTAVATAVFPCGIFLAATEIFKSESCTQMLLFLVFIVECFGLEELKQLKVLLYDDMCHLAPCIHKSRQLGPHYAVLDGLLKYIDAFHFPNHVSPHCIVTYDPKKEPLLAGVNTEVRTY